MKEYDVTITETLEKTVTVEAASKAEAEEMVRQQYYNSEYILDSENFTGVDFKLVDEREINLEDGCASGEARYVSPAGADRL